MNSVHKNQYSNVATDEYFHDLELYDRNLKEKKQALEG